MRATSFATAISLLAVSLGHSAANADSSGIIDFSSTLGSPPSPVSTTADTSPKAQPSAKAMPDAIAMAAIPLTFSPPTAAPPPVPSPPDVPAPPPPVPSRFNLFAGDADSLVARVIGHAEGTRSVDGSKTRAYYGHNDPGNGVWNLGSFSFQHCREYHCSTPEEADGHQLKRLAVQAAILEQRAQSLGITMTLLEELNGIDLANQAPLAALGKPGYAEWLQQAHKQGLTDAEAALWARVQSYWDPHRNGWNAPGLGNNEGSITHDQNRRLTAITRSLAFHQQKMATATQPPPSSIEKATKPPTEPLADLIIYQDLVVRQD